MKMLEARRLTGLNVIWARHCAVVDVALEPDEFAATLVSSWSAHVRSMLDAVAWHDEQSNSRRFAGGVSLAVSAPIDGLYAAVELAEWAYNATVREFGGESPDDFQAQVERIRSLIREEANPPLLELAKDAATQCVAFLWDDDEASVGLGKGSKTWPVSALPSDVDWTEIHNIPVGLVTGTNGKTTTVRLASRILRAAGLHVGLSSTDWVGVDNEIIERGDFSGPGGARTALRQRAADAAVLETARGGLLRRGLGVARADAAVITNIAEDHLGDFGSQNLQELLDLKWIVMRALDQWSLAILNADDAMLVDKAAELTTPIMWFSLNPENPVLCSHVSSAGTAVTVIDNAISRFDGEKWNTLCQVADVPITLNGVAKHNVANALAAVGLSSALGVDDTAIIAGLNLMTADDNPGRCNLFRVNGCDVLLDFAHNPDAMAAIFEIARSHPAKRRLLCFAQAGDRTDQQIRELARGAWAIGLERVIISELSTYRRGRQPGEVFSLLRDELIRAGADDNQVSHKELESESLAEALDWAEEGDLVIMLALGDSANLLTQLKSLNDA